MIQGISDFQIQAEPKQCRLTDMWAPEARHLLPPFSPRPSAAVLFIKMAPNGAQSKPPTNLLAFLSWESPNITETPLPNLLLTINTFYFRSGCIEEVKSAKNWGQKGRKKNKRKGKKRMGSLSSCFVFSNQENGSVY